jgi:hypothetical protein
MDTCAEAPGLIIFSEFRFRFYIFSHGFELRLIGVFHQRNKTSGRSRERPLQTPNNEAIGFVREGLVQLERTHCLILGLLVT